MIFAMGGNGCRVQVGGCGGGIRTKVGQRGPMESLKRSSEGWIDWNPDSERDFYIEVLCRSSSISMCRKVEALINTSWCPNIKVVEG